MGRVARIARPCRVGRRAPGYPKIVNSDVDTASALPEWASAVARELGLESAVDDSTSAETIAWLTSHVVDGLGPAPPPPPPVPRRVGPPPAP